jgi:hypothetical protein
MTGTVRGEDESLNQVCESLLHVGAPIVETLWRCGAERYLHRGMLLIERDLEDREPREPYPLARQP